MKIIAAIERPAVIRQILDHLGLATVAPSFRASPDPFDGSAVDPPRAWSYEPFLDNLPSPIRYSRSRGQRASLSGLASPSLRTRKIPLDALARRQ